jgi:hypothetical protein
MSQLQRVLGRGALAAVVTAAVAPAAACADSIVFVKDHDVWLAAPDGGSLHRVTRDGTAANPWRSPSQTDDGTIVAVRAQPNNAPLVRLRQNGEPLGEIVLPALVAGPLNPQVSPDGRLVAYEEANDAGPAGRSTDVFYSRTDQHTPRDAYPTPGRGARGPSWIDGSRALLGVGNTAVTQVVGQPAALWWDDWDHWDRFGGGGELKDGEYAAGVAVFARGYVDEGNQLVMYRTAGDFATLPAPVCAFTDPSPGPLGRSFLDPTLSADGRRLWWQEGDGVWTAELPAGADCSAIRPRLLIAGASEPDWSPAAVSPGAPWTPPGEQPGPDPTPRPDRPQRDADWPEKPRRGDDRPREKTATGVLRARLLGGPRLGAALRGGLRLRITAPAAGTVRAVAKRGRTTLAAGSARARGAGATTVTARFTRSGRRALRGARAARLTVRVTFAPRGGRPLTRTVAAALRR